MAYLSERKKIAKFSAIILAVVVVAMVFYWNDGAALFKWLVGQSKGSKKTEQVVQKKEIKLPEGMTQNLILEKNAELVKSFTYEKDGVKQSTIGFYSQNAPRANFDLYLKYLIGTKWALASDSISGSQDNLSLKVSRFGQTFFAVFSKDAVTGKSYVEISLMTPENGAIDELGNLGGEKIK